MRDLLVASLFAVVIAAVCSHAAADDSKAPVEVAGRVLILKQVTPEPTGPVNWGGLIILEIPDSGSRPPQDVKVDDGKCTPLGHVRGVATNREGRPMMGGGYTWYLFKAPAEGSSVEIEASYAPNGQSTPKPVKRHYQVKLDKNG